MVTALPGGRIAVRDSKSGDRGPVLRFSQAEWEAFLEGARKGEHQPWTLYLASAH